ncbi:signal peptidase I [Qiania dongpingensis]|uniref:Signal peptidase I n=1 Tax=Qiania dongpingensis TaxID=2763669 RepID=A0A7G9G547_9FIRM|nr:signal peptidase I [Qiania dongpingensis]QNM05929.1 signal peptidase I [Qiania dongpingensis]
MEENRQDWEDEKLEETLKALDQEKEREEKRKAKKEEKNVLRDIINLLIYAAIVFGITFLIITFVGQRTRVSGNSMYNTLSDGDNLILEKLSYRFHEPERFDIVVFRFTHKKDTFYIKRVIGLPGETVQIIGSDIYINGEILEEDYGLEPIQDAKRAAQPITLGEDEYFVMGDNRNDSSDSRDPAVANVKRSQIVGKAWLRIWPLNKIGFISHR